MLLRRAGVLVAALLVPALAAAEQPPRPTEARAPDAGPRLAELLRDADAAYAHRDEPGRIAEIRERLAEAEKLAPDDYEVLWRLSRLQFWLADDPSISNKERSRLGKIGWGYGDRATAANPARIEGWHFAAAGMGMYALGIGIFSALRQGIEGKVKERLSRAEKIDPDFQGGSIQTAWGRFWYELPWPKYDARKSRQALEEALRKNPNNVRAHVYLAELHEKENRLGAARAELETAAAGAPGRYDAPEERRWQAVARRMLAKPRDAAPPPEPSGG